MKAALFRRNIRLFYLSAILTGMVGVFAPTLIIYQTQVLGLSMAQFMLGEGIFALAIMLFEIPSGIWADKFSRRKTLIFGNIMAFLGLLLFGLAQNFLHIIISQIMIGIALAARSGADQAVIYDSLAALGETENYQQVLSKIKSIEYGTAIFATMGGGLIAEYFGLRWPSIIAAFAWGSIAIILYFLKEPEIQRLNKKTSFLEYGKKGFVLIRQSKFLLWLIIFSALAFIGLKINFQTLNPLWEVYNVPLIWFGFALAAYNVVAMTTTLLIPKFLKRFGSIKALGVLWFVLTIGFAGVGIIYLGTVGAILFPIIFQIARSILPIVSNDLLQKETESSTRATLISMKSFVTNLSCAFYLWFFGVFADAYGLFQGFHMTTLLLLIGGGYALWQINKHFVRATNTDKKLVKIEVD